jgi:hypothetical protein
VGEGYREMAFPVAQLIYFTPSLKASELVIPDSSKVGRVCWYNLSDIAYSPAHPTIGFQPRSIFNF